MLSEYKPRNIKVCFDEKCTLNFQRTDLHNEVVRHAQSKKQQVKKGMDAVLAQPEVGVKLSPELCGKRGDPPPPPRGFGHNLSLPHR